MESKFEKIYKNSKGLNDIDFDNLTPEMFKLCLEFCYNCGVRDGMNEMFETHTVLPKEHNYEIIKNN